MIIDFETKHAIANSDGFPAYPAGAILLATECPFIHLIPLM